MEVAGPLGTPLGLAQRKRASSCIFLSVALFPPPGASLVAQSVKNRTALQDAPSFSHGERPFSEDPADFEPPSNQVYQSQAIPEAAVDLEINPLTRR